MEGAEVDIVWQGRRARAFVPRLLAERDLTLDAKAEARCGAATQAVGHGAAALPEDYAPLARLLVRAEGIASSYIEGVAAPAIDLLLAQREDRSPAAWVAANLAATDQALTHAASRSALTLATLCSWHAALMAGSPTPTRHVGRLRREQGWIGGTSPLDAHLVTPPPAELPAQVKDLLAFLRRTDVDPVAQAAIAHAQFEVIHPFADGNGRVGRVLVSWILTRRLQLLTPPPVSVSLARDVGGYAAGLTQFRLGQTSAWVRWFADVVTSASDRQERLVRDVDQLREQWGERLVLRVDAAAWRVLEMVPAHLLLSARLVADELGVTTKTAHEALGRLAEAGVLTGYDVVAGVGRPTRYYLSEELLGLS